LTLFVTIVIGLIGVRVTLAASELAGAGGGGKGLSAALVLNSSLEVPQEFIGKVDLTVEGSKTGVVSLIDVVLENTGDEEILPEDYVRPVAFFVQDDAEIVSAEILEETPVGINASIEKISGNTVIMSRFLVNPSDSVKARLIVVGNESGSLEVDWRIARVADVILVDRTKVETKDLKGGFLDSLGERIAFAFLAYLVLAFSIAYIVQPTLNRGIKSGGASEANGQAVDEEGHEVDSTVP
jgi:hypothetical protein